MHSSILSQYIMDIEGSGNNQPIIAYQDNPPLLMAEQTGDSGQPSLQYQVKIQIETKKESVNFIGNLLIFQDDYHLAAGEVDIRVDYRITGSLGTNGTSLMIFVDSDQKDEEEEGLAEEGEPEEENPGDEVLKLIKSEQRGNFLLQGSCTIVINFETHETMQEAYTKISDQLGEEEEWNSQYACDDQLEQMIRAEDIDEDGNIILPSNDQCQRQEMAVEVDSQMVDQNQE